MSDQANHTQSARRALSGASLGWYFTGSDPRNGFSRTIERDGTVIVEAHATCHSWGWWVGVEWTDAPDGRIAACGKLPTRDLARQAADAAMRQLMHADIPPGFYDITAEGLQATLRGNFASPPPPTATTGRQRPPQRADMPAGGLFDDDARRQLALF